MASATVSALSFGEQRPAPAFVLLRGERIIIASDGLAALTGYTRGELTSPEFRLAHLFAPDEGPFLPFDEKGERVRRSAARLDPLRGERMPCRVTVWRLDEARPPLLVALLDVDEEDAPAARVEESVIARELVRACRSHFAEIITRLRRLQLDIEALELAHPEVLAHETVRLAPLFEQLARLDAEAAVLARIACWREHAPSSGSRSPL